MTALGFWATNCTSLYPLCTGISEFYRTCILIPLLKDDEKHQAGLELTVLEKRYSSCWKFSVAAIVKCCAFVIQQKKQWNNWIIEIHEWLQRILPNQDFTVTLKTHDNAISVFLFPYTYEIRRNRNVCGRTLIYLVHSTSGLTKNNNFKLKEFESFCVASFPVFLGYVQTK